ncbi:hypothetical protein FRC06_008288, partial [Ceratobasidium sp. 370]
MVVVVDRITIVISEEVTTPSNYSENVNRELGGPHSAWLAYPMEKRPFVTIATAHGQEHKTRALGMRSLLSLALASLAIPRTFGLLAFPGAEGFGANAIGGRGGSVYIVTNLNDSLVYQDLTEVANRAWMISGSGSFRDAVSQPNRIVVFAVGGVIKISSRVVVSDHITIAGQTAPGGGITIYGNGLSYSNAHHTITRYIRFRMGKGGDSGKDGITIADGHDMIFDHISVSWGRGRYLHYSLELASLSLLADETFSINGDVANITISDSIIAQGLETHSCGGLMQTETGGI